MPTVIDANVLVALFSSSRDDSKTKRVNHLLEEMRRRRGRLYIPTPALSEFAAKASDDEMDFIQNQAAFYSVPFDKKAAIECGDLIREWAKGEDKEGRHEAKFDIQIIAILKAINADTLITSDKQLKKRASGLGFKVMDIMDIHIPEDVQADLFRE
ncbi:type II toxin-antitoxin system VapC family toxin [Chromobacterium haemolyticum]|uniref:type II toxin-antitoxin system VapC family toxin n=1 Tax=Chromobacterium haemolyticum TaxID=394935 RepID=UPI0013196329|nr:type II toxin-antitoxin system VapC family toxin [Chromobacterium haemolyticum]BBH12920.1 hypothetical protein CH06BL_21680 [Chromobacterium haemolyticum]